MKKENNKKSASALIGAAFLMATSAIGPGFLTQTGKFTWKFRICNSDLRDLGSDRTVKCMESFVCIWNAWTGCSQQSAPWTWIFDRVFSCRWGTCI